MSAPPHPARRATPLRVAGGLGRVLFVLACLVLGIFMNGISRSLPERLTMVPVCIVLAGLTLVVAMGW